MSANALLRGAGLGLALAGAVGLAEAGGLTLKVETGQPLLDGLRAHAAPEVTPDPVPHLAVELLVSLKVLDLEVLEPVPDLLEPVDLPPGAIPDLAALPVRALPELAARVALGPCGLKLGEVLLQLGLTGLDVAVATLLELPALDPELGLNRWQVPRPGIVVHVLDHGT